MKRRIRLISSLAVALVLITAMGYTALAGGDIQEPVVTPAELLADDDLRGRLVQLEGVAANAGEPKTVDGTTALVFDVQDRDSDQRVSVTYTGSVPDAFRNGRQVLVKGRLNTSSTFVAEPDSLVTKCPSKFQGEGAGGDEHPEGVPKGDE